MPEPNCVCLNCGKEFYTKPSHIARGGGKYCSKECRHSHSYKTSKCEYCGKEFSHLKSKNRKFCSRECQRKSIYDSHRLSKIPCKRCGKIFKPSHSTTKYCSVKCGIFDRRKSVLIRCDNCGKTFIRKKSLINEHNFCSDSCLKLFRSNKMKGNKYRHGIKHNQETKELLRQYMLKRFKDPSYVEWFKNQFFRNDKRMNNLESFFNEITPEEVVFKGDGKFFVTFKDGRVKNPDFVISHQRKVIELFGDYWHKGENPQELIDQYNKIGFDCLVFWESEVYNNTDEVLRKVLDFIDNNE